MLPPALALALILIPVVTHLLAPTFDAWLPLVSRLAPAAHAQQDTRPATTTRIHLPLVLRAAHRDALPAAATAPPAPATATARSSTATATAAPTERPTQAPTQVPTEPPTALPTATATALPTATATPDLACENLVANGDFEAGARDWTLVVTTQEQPLSLAIVRRAEGPIPPHGGDTYAYLGGLDDTSFNLHSRRLPRFDSEEVARATLRFWTALISSEQPNRRPGDRLRPYIDSGRRFYVEDAARSEEDLSPMRQWQQVEVDVTPMLDRGAQHVGFDVVTDRARSSWFYLDDVQLEICRAR